jgi:serine/threonine protein kinase
VLDAVRVEDNKRVVIKQVEAGSDEVAICRMLSSPELRNDPHNHAVPVLDYFTKDDEPQHGFLVMPLLRKFDDPPFGTVGEVVDFVRQMLQVIQILGIRRDQPLKYICSQGIIFIHNLNVAHRSVCHFMSVSRSCAFTCLSSDCYLGNIMMDATELIPDGFHPQFPSKTLDLSQEVKPLSRSALKFPMRYYFIDFGESSWFRAATSSEDDGKPARQPVDKTLRRLVQGGKCQDQLISELNSRKPYDPFIFDVGILGDVFEVAFVEVSSTQSSARTFSLSLEILQS